MKRAFAIISCVLFCLAHNGVFGQAGGGDNTGPNFGATLGCTPTFSFTLRQTWLSGSTTSYLYDAYITNVGFTGDASSQNQNSYPISSLTDIQLAVNGTSGTLTQYWNIDINNDQGPVPGYFYFNLPSGIEIDVGQAYSWGFVIAGAPATALTGANPVERTCDQPATTTASSVSASTTSSSSAAASTSGSVSTTTGSSSGSTSSCQASATVTARANGSYQSGSGVAQIYDIVVLNSGSCQLTNIVLNIALASGTVSQSWNLVEASNLWTVTGYQGLLPVGNSINVGVVVQFPTSLSVPNAVSASVSATTCSSSCLAASSTASSTSATTASSATTAAPASTTSSSSGVTSTSCQVSTTTTARAGATYQVGSGVQQIYDIVVYNSGTCAINNIVLNLALPSGSVSSSWNLQATSANLQYTVTSYQGTLPIGNSVNAGIIVTFPNTQSVPAGVSASASTTTCNVCSN